MLCICEISRCFNYRPNEILIIKVEKFNTSFIFIGNNNIDLYMRADSAIVQSFFI